MSLRLTFMLCQQYVMSSSIVTTLPFDVCDLISAYFKKTSAPYKSYTPLFDIVRVKLNCLHIANRIFYDD